MRQTDAIAQAIRDGLEKVGIKSLSKVARGDESGWVVLDYVSVIAHVFYKPMREFYSLENLWSDAKKIRVVPRKTKIAYRYYNLRFKKIKCTRISRKNLRL